MGYAVILGQIHTVLLLSDASKRVKSQAVFSNYGLINQLELSYLPIEVMYVYTYIYISDFPWKYGTTIYGTSHIDIVFLVKTLVP